MAVTSKFVFGQRLYGLACERVRLGAVVDAVTLTVAVAVHEAPSLTVTV